MRLIDFGLTGEAPDHQDFDASQNDGGTEALSEPRFLTRTARTVLGCCPHVSEPVLGHYFPCPTPGSPFYMPPELLITGQSSPMHDMWSVAVTVYEIGHTHLPFPNVRSKPQLRVRLAFALPFFGVVWVRARPAQGWRLRRAILRRRGCRDLTPPLCFSACVWSGLAGRGDGAQLPVG